MSDQAKMFEKEYVVTDDVAIHFMGPNIAPVLSTPSMINWMEHTCRDHVSSLLAPGEDTVGMQVDVKHLAATPVGMKVRVVSKLAKVEGRVYSFEVEAFDETDKIGEGFHKRASVNVAKFDARIRAKKQSSAHAG
jgi:fluoroacetyl-CoA thioesterase